MVKGTDLEDKVTLFGITGLSLPSIVIYLKFLNETKFSHVWNRGNNVHVIYLFHIPKKYVKYLIEINKE